MHYLKKISLFYLFVILLTGCHVDYSSSYFLKHPARLEAEVARCQGLNPVARSEDRVCDIAMSTAEQVSELVKVWQAQPEAFGQQILKAQLALVEARTAVRLLTKKVNKLKLEKSGALLNQAEADLQQAKQSLNAKQDEVNAMMVVVGLASPE